ncbi:M23 family metallopeptidase, partial [Dehalococcoidia bacterium]|nr:M23 family metallopeptidase [Dehalococcoidia bacterium]
MKPDIAIRFFTKNKKVIPLLFNTGGFWTTHIKLPDLVVTNKSKGFVKLCQLNIIGKSDGNKVVTYEIDEEALKSFIQRVNPQFNTIIGDPNLQYHFRIQFGKITVAGEKLAESETLNPHESVVVPLSLMLFFDYTGRCKIDELKLILTVDGELGKTIVEFPISLTYYQTKGDYIFPLKGSLLICSLPMNVTQHRIVLSQEFAFDVLSVKQVESGEFATSSKFTPKDLCDYFVFQREVMAIGDGIIVEVGNKFPESKMSDTQSYSEEFFSELSKELTPKIGFLNTLCGNYIVIDHENGQFSFYAHLSENSILVRVGERVRKGDTIAKIGNTGHSTEPHLHFQLMDN